MPNKKSPKQQDGLVATKLLADRSGEPYDTIDHWASSGLLDYRRKGRTRFFALTENLRRCKQIRALQDEGHSLTTIKKMVAQN
ncbi:MAG: MerR family transcriptional regulator [Planctomycetes bacterium]|nr:MerR family transcriptional regulator [Planctomycetota bacterium]